VPPRALDQGARLRRLIDELLLVAAAQHSGLQADIAPVDIAHVVDDVVSGLADRAGGRLHLELIPGTGRVATDEDKVLQITGNLVENALKYAPDGPITVRTERSEAGVTVSVSDKGPGIPPDDRQRVFEPFVQLDQSSTRRTGLGLHLCRQLADLLGGRLDLDEAPGGGCRFTLRLPDALQPNPRPDSGPPTGVTVHQPRRSPGMTRPYRLLVVDDEPDIRDLVAINFTVEGFEVLTAADGHEAEQIARAERPDVIVLDVMMPGRDGLQVLASLRADPDTRDIPVVLLSAKSTNEEVLEGWRAGTSNYMTKPFYPDELVRYVCYLLSDDYLTT
jgi:CheY-like chemotaxis protein